MSSNAVILVACDFGGSGNAARNPRRIDIDCFDQVLVEFAPHVEVASGIAHLPDAELQFRSLSDFEPDSIFRQCELFQEPEPRLRDDVADPETEEALAPADIHNDAEWQLMIERLVAPYADPGESPERLAANEERTHRTSLLMKTLLHDPRFQAVEAAWRGLHLLVRDGLADVLLMDCAKEHFASRLEEFIHPGGYSLIVANYTFDRNVHADVQLLSHLAELAQRAETSLIAEALPSQTENSIAWNAWLDLRKSPAAEWVSLALPRFLLRLPYGAETTPVEAFPFEEMTGAPRHNDYLWGSPVFALAAVLSRGERRLEGLPVHVYEDNGEFMIHPCGEVLLSERDCELLTNQGLTPLASVKGADAIAFPSIQSVADPPTGILFRL